MEKGYAFWSESEDALIDSMRAEDKSYSQIAFALSARGTPRTRTAVAGRIARMKTLALPPEELEALRVAERARAKEVKRNRGRPRPVAKPRPVKTSVQTPEKKERGVPKVQKRYIAREKLLPFVTTKQGTLLHVYERNPHALMPLATYERQGAAWVRRSDEARFPSISEAVRAMEGA